MATATSLPVPLPARPAVTARRWPLILAVAGCLAIFLPLAMPGDHIICEQDYWFYQVPVRQFVREEILAGRFPLWVPYLGCGTPLHAGQQASICYPFLTPFVVLLPVNFGIRLSLFLHLAFGFWGQYRLARWMRMSESAASFSAMLVTCGAFVFGHLMAGHVNLILEVGWLPWFFLVLFKLLRQPGPWPAAGLAAIVALFVMIGHPQVPYYALLIGFLWALGSLACGDAAQHRFRVIGWGTAAVLIAVLLSLVQVLPFLELYGDGVALSDRGKVGESSYHSFHRLDLLTLISPNSMGNPYAALESFDDAYTAYHEKVAYLGLAPLFLAALALSRARSRHWQWGIVGLFVLGLLIALEYRTPVYSMLSHIPGLRLFRCPGRLFGVLAVPIALLAAQGLDDLLRGERRAEGLRRALWWLVPGIAFATALFILWDAGRKLDDYLVHIVSVLPQQVAGTTFFLGVTLIVLLWGRRAAAESPQLVSCLLLLVTFGDMWFFQLRHFDLPHLTVDTPPGLPTEGTDGMRIAVDAPTYWDWRYSYLTRTAIQEHWSTPATNEGGVLPGSVERLYKRLSDPDTMQPALQACAVDYLYRPGNKCWDAVENSLPRLRFCKGEEPPQAFEYEQPGEGTLTVQHEDPQALRLTAKVPAPEWLIVADTHYPGWVCRVDGEERPIAQVHGCFRGVKLEAGEHSVEFTYRPRSFLYGTAGSGVGLVLLGGVFWFGRPKRSA